MGRHAGFYMKDKQFQRLGTQNVEFVEFAFCTRYWVGNFFLPKNRISSYK